LNCDPYREKAMAFVSFDGDEVEGPPGKIVLDDEMLSRMWDKWIAGLTAIGLSTRDVARAVRMPQTEVSRRLRGTTSDVRRFYAKRTLPEILDMDWDDD
jgi:hypothetical protein